MTVQAFDTTTKTWSTLAPLPQGRFSLAAVGGPDGRLYAIGGDAPGGFLTTVEVYIPSSNVWFDIARMNLPRAALAAAAGSDGRIYAFGGDTGNGLTNTVEAYDAGTNSWSMVAPMPRAVDGAAAATGSDGRTYVFGGFNGSALNTVQAYNPRTNSWSMAAPMPTASFAAAAAVGADGRIYVLGGSNTGGGQTVEAYDPTTNSWSTVAPLPIGRNGLAAALGPDGRVYAFGGYNGNFLNTVEALQKSATTTTVRSSANASVFRQSITFTATVRLQGPGSGSPTGAVQFQIDGTDAGNPVNLQINGGLATATFRTGTLTVGSHTITAGYQGDGNFTASSGVLTGGQKVGKASTNTAITSSANPSASGQSLTFKATVHVVAPGAGSPSGTVQFQIDGSPFGSPVALSGEQATSIGISSLLAGSHTVRAIYSGDTSFSISTGSLTQTISVAATVLVVSGFPSPSIAGASAGFTVTAKDPLGETATNYRGTIHFSSSDNLASLPANYTFTAADKGSHTFRAALKTAGNQSLTATDTRSSSIKGTTVVAIQAAAADHFLIMAPPAAVSGMPFDVQVTALDPYGNTDRNYQGTVTFTSTDSSPGVVLPSDYTFTTGASGDNGVRAFPAGFTLMALGDQTLTAKDTVSGIRGSATVTVGSGGAAAPRSRPPSSWAFTRLADIPATPNATTAPQAAFVDELFKTVERGMIWPFDRQD
jgi:N-acetylneuraminic acid mutarotase